MTRRRPHRRLFRLLLRVYPREYRARYAREMEDVFDEEWKAAWSGRGVRSRAAFAVRIVWDHLEASVAVRRGARESGMGMLGDDLRNALRALGRAPTFVLFAVGTLALGVGATTAVFTMVDRVVLRPLPYEGADRLVRVGMRFRHAPDEVGVSSPAVLGALIDESGPAEAVAGVAGGGAILDGPGEPLRVDLSRVSADYFGMFQARAAEGRLLLSTDHEGAAARVVVLGHGFWQERFGADPSAVGSTIRLDGEPFTVVGVLEPGQVAPDGLNGGGDVWLPLDLTGERARGSFFIHTVARLRRGAAPAELDAHVDRLAGTIYPGDGPVFVVGAGVVDLQSWVVGDIGSTLGRVMAAVLLLLVIACANVASLLLTRSADRAREFAVRAALGAGRGRLIRQLMAENLVLGLAGGALGAGLAFVSVALFTRYAPGGIPRLAETAVDARGLAFSLTVSVGTLLLFGLLPALKGAGRGAAAGAARLARGATASRADGRLRAAFVLAETALSVVLAVGAGLLARDLMRVAREDPGFRPDGLVAMVVDLDGRMDGDDPANSEPFWNTLLEGAQALPGARVAALAAEIPYGPGGIVSIYTPEGREDEEGGAWVSVVPFLGDYPAAMSAGIVAGRGLAPEEMDGGASVALVNESFVRAYWPDRTAVGRHVKSGSPEVDDEGGFDVVGVVADVRGRPGVEATPRLYVPFASEPSRRMELLVRTEGDPAALAPALRDLARRSDPGLPIMEVRTVEALAHAALGRPRFYTALFGGFALVALLLAVVGVYGTTAYATRLRAREIGIRLALGARRGGVVGRVVARAGGLVALGVAFGLAGAALGSRALDDVLLQVDPADAPTYVLVGTLVLAFGLWAAWVPARRASRVDLVRTLREEQ